MALTVICIANTSLVQLLIWPRLYMSLGVCCTPFNTPPQTELSLGLLSFTSISRGILYNNPCKYWVKTTCLLTTLYSLAWSQEGFWQLSFCRNCALWRLVLWGKKVVHHFISFLEEKECVQKLKRMKNRLDSTFIFSSCKKWWETPLLFCRHNKGFINYTLCRNWAVRNHAGTMLDSLVW